MHEAPSAGVARRRVAALLLTVAIAAASLATVVTRAAAAESSLRRISSVTFRGGPKTPSILVRGRNLGSKPAPNPPVSPSGELLCGVTFKGQAGLDYGTKLYLLDVTQKWAAGRHRPRLLELDCIGLIVTRFTQTEVVYRLGSGYAQFYDRYSLAEGDLVELGVNGAAITVHVRYGATVAS